MRRLWPFGHQRSKSSPEPEQVPVEPVAERVQEPDRLVIKWQTGECLALEPTNLSDVAVIAQALDNQWVSRDLLAYMQRRAPRDGLYDHKVTSRRDPVVRAEYLRALINADQLVVNRAFMYNTSAVSKDYKLRDGGRPESSQDFKALLELGIIVPYLFREQTPADLPAGLYGREQGDFSIDRDAFEEWIRICQEVRTRCVRLSWDDKRNIELTNGMAGTFNLRARALDGPIEFGSASRYYDDLGVPESLRDEFVKRLREVIVWSAGQGRVSRDALYQQFIVTQDSPTWQGKYDSHKHKPFSSALKQLFDLNYAVNLTDALGLYTLTPIDALPRTSLQELAVRIREGRERGVELTPEDVSLLLRQFAFSLVQGGAYLRSMGDLTLRDVLDIRDTDAWASYIQMVRNLLRNPAAALRSGTLQQGLEAVYQSYAQLAEEMTRRVKANRGRVNVEKWEPLATLSIDFGSALLTAAIVSPSLGLPGALVYSFTGNVLQDQVGMVARLLIRGASAVGAQADLEASLDFMRAQLRGAKDLEKELHGLMSQIGFREVANLQERLTRRQYDETVNFPEDLALAAAS